VVPVKVLVTTNPCALSSRVSTNAINHTTVTTTDRETLVFERMLLDRSPNIMRNQTQINSAGRRDTGGFCSLT
jgi:hypothetical protein